MKRSVQTESREIRGRERDSSSSFHCKLYASTEGQICRACPALIVAASARSSVCASSPSTRLDFFLLFLLLLLRVQVTHVAPLCSSCRVNIHTTQVVEPFPSFNSLRWRKKRVALGCAFSEPLCNNITLLVTVRLGTLIKTRSTFGGLWTIRQTTRATASAVPNN